MIYILQDFVGTGFGAVSINAAKLRDTLLIQIDTTDAATVEIQGRLNPNLGWATVETVSAVGPSSTLVKAAVSQHIRVNVTANSGQVTVVANT